jgi:hypothetical protein
MVSVCLLKVRVCSCLLTSGPVNVDIGVYINYFYEIREQTMVSINLQFVHIYCFSCVKTTSLVYHPSRIKPLHAHRYVKIMKILHLCSRQALCKRMIVGLYKNIFNKQARLHLQAAVCSILLFTVNCQTETIIMKFYHQTSSIK